MFQCGRKDIFNTFETTYWTFYEILKTLFNSTLDKYWCYKSLQFVAIEWKFFIQISEFPYSCIKVKKIGKKAISDIIEGLQYRLPRINLMSERLFAHR